ncbi:hypothetical protein RDABS01_030523 [Bienertia sinuspersici]
MWMWHARPLKAKLVRLECLEIVLAVGFWASRKSIMYVSNAGDIWKQLEQRFTVTNGARKYRLNKAVYETKQSGRMIADYYTELKSLWEEIESLRDFPPITQLNTEINENLNARRKDEEEQRLFRDMKLNPAGMLTDFLLKGRNLRGRQKEKKRRQDKREAQQLEKLLKLLPMPSLSGDEESVEDMEVNYAELMACNFAQSTTRDWIIDLGATLHMTGDVNALESVRGMTQK